jgi:poly(A) polymerase
MRFADVPRMKESTFKRFLRLLRFAEHLELHRLDCLASHGNLDIYRYTKEKFETMPAEETRPERLISGDDLIAGGYRPGPLFREILSAVEDEQLECRLRDRQEALQFVRRQYPLQTPSTR